MDQPPAKFEPRGIWELAWPAVVANLLHSTVGLVDMKIVGTLGPSAIAAATTGQRIFFVLQAVLMAVTAGTTALVARAWGGGNRREAERVASASIVVCLSIAALITIPALLFARPMAAIFSLDDATLDLAAVYIRWLSAFNLAFAFFFALTTALRAAGDTRTPLWIGAIANVVNVILAYGLVFGELGVPGTALFISLPKLGVAGAAIAGGGAFTIGSLILLWLWLRGSLLLGTGGAGSVSRSRIGQMFHIGYPAALEQGVWQSGFILFLWLVALYGTAPYAAYGIGVSILAFSFVVGFGFSIAASTLVGQHLGAGDAEGAAQSGWRGMRLSMGAMAVLGLVIIASAETIAGFMIDDPEVVRLTVIFIYILGAVQPLMAIEFALGGALRGAGDTRFPLFVVTTGLLGARCTLAGLFAWLDWSVEWIFAALIADYVVKATLLTLRFRTDRWKNLIESPAGAVEARG